MYLKSFAAMAATILTTPAFAQDEPAPSLGGFRVEAVGGYDGAEVNDDDDGGIVFGIGAGYDFQVGRRAILGLEAEATETSNDGCVADLLQVGDRTCARLGRDLYVGARAGVMVARNVQLYARAGYTNLRYSVDYDAGPAGGTDFSFRQNLDGIRVGAGAQLHVSRNAYLGGEFRYSNYESDSDRGQFVGTLGFRF